MIIDDLKNINFYSTFNHSIKLAFDFIKANATRFTKEGRYEINENIFTGFSPRSGACASLGKNTAKCPSFRTMLKSGLSLKNSISFASS